MTSIFWGRECCAAAHLCCLPASPDCGRQCSAALFKDEAAATVAVALAVAKVKAKAKAKCN